MRIILIGNYSPDRQESMLRFAQLINSGFRDAGHDSEIWQPTIRFGSFFKDARSGVAKWLAHIDKWILFPLELSWRVRKEMARNANIRFQICDHSNAPYLAYLPKEFTVVTCHDVLAIRGALGYKDAYCTASFTGKILQKWILRNLDRATLLAAASKLTLTQLKALSSETQGQKRDWRIIPLGFNADFRPLDAKQRNDLLVGAGLKPETPFVLHVGSDQERKNRRMLIDMVAALGNKWNGKIYYAGQAADEKLLSYAESLGLRERVVSVVGPDHATLLALYSGCEAFIWPSFSEGFGWPLIEAQACGAPVISSNIEPMPEVSNGAAIHADPTQPGEFADAFLKLQDASIRTDLIRRGLENIERFRPSRMIDAYLNLHGLKNN